MSVEVSESISLMLPRWKALGVLASKSQPTTVRVIYHPGNGFRCERLDGRPVDLADAERADADQVMAVKMRLVRQHGARSNISSTYIRRVQEEESKKAPTPNAQLSGKAVPRSSESAALEPIREQRRPTNGDRLVNVDPGVLPFRMAVVREQARRRSVSGTRLNLDLQTTGDEYIADDDLCIEVPVVTEVVDANSSRRQTTTSLFRIGQPEVAQKLKELRESTSFLRRQTPPADAG
jgi:hypothetical protein